MPFFLESVGARPSALVQHSPLDRLVNRPHLDVVMREPISQLQARAQRFDEAPMPRFRPPVDLREKVLVLLQQVSFFKTCIGCQLMRLENGRLSLYSSATDFHNAR